MPTFFMRRLRTVRSSRTSRAKASYIWVFVRIDYCVENGCPYFAGYFLHQPAVVQSPAAVELADLFHDSAVHGYEGSLRIDVRHDRPYKGVVDVGYVSSEDGDRGSNIVEMNTHVLMMKRLSSSLSSSPLAPSS
jgi:hypothetical protein